MFSRLRLWQLISPVLPVGAYSYSQGLEYAVENGWVNSEQSVLSWIEGLLAHSLAYLDVPVLKRLYDAWRENNTDQVEYWNRFLIASRETAELRAEDRQMGAALANLLPELGLREALLWKSATQSATFASMFALAATRWEVDAKQAAEGYCWCWCENQVIAAVKLVPLGQTAGQRLLMALGEAIPVAVETGFALEDEGIGWIAPGFVMASMKHETQYTRLFRS